MTRGKGGGSGTLWRGDLLAIPGKWQFNRETYTVCTFLLSRTGFDKWDWPRSGRAAFRSGAWERG